MSTETTSNAKQIREDLEHEPLTRRREFLKRTLLTSAYVAPLAVSFAVQDLVRAGSGHHGDESEGHESRTYQKIKSHKDEDQEEKGKKYLEEQFKDKKHKKDKD